jgi:MerR family transcriptional regulator/heat shock protein HspR
VIDKDTPVYMISIVARLAGVHPQTLRFYESEGLIKPSRTAGKTRLYSERDLVRVKRIVSLTRERKVNVAGAHLILKMEEELEQLFQTVAEHLDDAVKESLALLLEDMNFEELNIERLIEILRSRR